MRQSQLFTKTRKDAPKDEVSKNAQILTRAGFVHKEMAGVYSFLPLGLRVLNNVSNVIRSEMNAVGGQEVLMSSLQPKDIWEKTNRWDDAVVDAWFKTKLKDGADIGLGFTHEEPLTRIMTQYIHSHADLPKIAYQIQWKFRNEERAKSGVMRGREFLMKDLYTFSRTEEEHDSLYETIAGAYERVFKRLGIGERTYKTFASGGSFSKYSHEFQCLVPVGEDTVFVSKDKRVAINAEVMSPEVLSDLGLDESELNEEKAVEVGNIFSLGTRFSDALGLTYTDTDGNHKPVVMGCYGIGPSRLVGTLVEVLGSDIAMLWPHEVSPFAVHLISISGGNADVDTAANEMYDLLQSGGVDVLFDDRDVRAGEKFADSDLIGIPTRLVISEKTIAADGIEMISRARGESKIIPRDTVVSILNDLAETS